jgi:hypothetical protein
MSEHTEDTNPDGADEFRPEIQSQIKKALRLSRAKLRSMNSDVFKRYKTTRAIAEAVLVAIAKSGMWVGRRGYIAFWEFKQGIRHNGRRVAPPVEGAAIYVRNALKLLLDNQLITSRVALNNSERVIGNCYPQARLPNQYWLGPLPAEFAVPPQVLPRFRREAPQRRTPDTPAVPRSRTTTQSAPPGTARLTTGDLRRALESVPDDVQIWIDHRQGGAWAHHISLQENWKNGPHAVVIAI